MAELPQVPMQGGALVADVAAPQLVTPARRLARRGLLQLTPYLVILALFVACGLVPQWIAPMNPLTNHLLERLHPVATRSGGVTYWLGTDDLGRDVLSRIVYGAQVSLLVALTSDLICASVGGLLGLVAGYFQRTAGSIIMRLADVMLSVPFLLLAILLVSVLGPSNRSLIVALSVTQWPVFARMASAVATRTAKADFVMAAEASGASHARILFRHIAPYVMSSLLVIAMIQFGTFILYEAGMSFLGLGAPPPAPSWGSMLSEGQLYITTAWWMITFPGIALFLVVLSINRVGDVLQVQLNPERRRGR
jgi:peptide/nickel transport system permease protein